MATNFSQSDCVQHVMSGSIQNRISDRETWLIKYHLTYAPLHNQTLRLRTKSNKTTYTKNLTPSSQSFYIKPGKSHSTYSSHVPCAVSPKTNRLQSPSQNVAHFTQLTLDYVADIFLNCFAFNHFVTILVTKKGVHYE